MAKLSLMCFFFMTLLSQESKGIHIQRHCKELEQIEWNMAELWQVTHVNELDFISWLQVGTVAVTELSRHGRWPRQTDANRKFHEIPRSFTPWYCRRSWKHTFLMTISGGIIRWCRDFGAGQRFRA